MNEKIEKLIESILAKVKDLTVLNIETVMGSLVTDAQGEIVFKPGQDIDGIVSKIDLIDGDIKTQMTEKFYKNYPELVQFHQSREAKGHEIIEGNMEALKSIVLALRAFNK